MKKKSSNEETDKFHSLVEIDELRLNEEFKKIPGLLARYNNLYADALRSFLKAEHRRKKTYARLLLSFREDYDGKRAPSEATLKAMIEADDDYEQAKLSEIRAEVEKTRLWGMIDALRTKKDALVNIGAHIRAELGADPSMKHRAREDRRRDKEGESIRIEDD